MSKTLDLVYAYFSALEQGIVGDELAAFFDPEVIQEEFPNRLMPNGAHRDLAAILDGAERGKKVMSNQKYEIVNAVAQGNSAAVEFLWSGVALIELGSLPVGGVMKGRFATFIEFKGEKIVSQRSYDCFEAW